LHHLLAPQCNSAKPTPFWSGTFARKVDRALQRGARNPATLRTASWREISPFLAEARRTLPLASDQSVIMMLRKNPDIILAICLPDGTATGLFAYLPLNVLGAGLVTGGGFDGARPDPAWICRRGEHPEAIYIWLVLAPNRLSRVLASVAALFCELAPQGVPIFSRAVTGHSERVQLSSGFFPARQIYPKAPEWLLVALPEGGLAVPPAQAAEVQPTVELVRSMEGLARVFALRAATYIAEQFCTYEEEFDGNDFCATHFVGTLNGDAAGCIRLRYFAGFAKLERLCVRREYRGRGVKERLIGEALDHARMKGYRRVYGHARSDLLDMWRGFGFEPVAGRPAFRFAGIDYVEILAKRERHPATIRLGLPPMMLTRPEGRWDEPGPLDLSNLDPDPLRAELIARHTRFRSQEGR
jgi:predicted GNAT family N-acyltransferase